MIDCRLETAASFRILISCSCCIKCLDTAWCQEVHTACKSYYTINHYKYDWRIPILASREKCPYLRSLVVTTDEASGWFSMVWVSTLSFLWHCWLGDRKNIRPVEKLCHLSQKVLYNKWQKNTEGHAADPGSPGKRLLKWWCDWRPVGTVSWSR